MEGDFKDDFRIRCFAGEHESEWLVIRLKDQRIVFQDSNLVQALRWLDTWGLILGYSKRGKPLGR